MPITKPTDLPRWAEDTGGTPSVEIDEPSSGRKDVGWEDAQIPPHNFFNWWMQKVYKWTQYLDDLVNQALTWTVAQVFQEGITVTSSTGVAVQGTGHGLSPGGEFQGGASGPGIIATAGDGNGGTFAGAGTAGRGVKADGAGSGVGVQGTGGATGAGVSGVGGATSGAGVRGVASAGNSNGVEGVGHGNKYGGEFTAGDGGTNWGVSSTGGSGSNSGGVVGVGGSTNGIGVQGSGTGGSPGVSGSSDTGPGLYGSANATRGAMHLVPRASAPASPSEGDSYYDSTLHKNRTWDGSAWQAWW